jgi:excisionase family DNA binding protein
MCENCIKEQLQNIEMHIELTSSEIYQEMVGIPGKSWHKAGRVRNLGDDIQQGKPSQPLLTIGEAAARLGVTAKTIKNWERDGQIPIAKRDYRNQRVYTAADVEEIRRVKRLGEVFYPNTNPPDTSPISGE